MQWEFAGLYSTCISIQVRKSLEGQCHGSLCDSWLPYYMKIFAVV